MSDDSAVEPIDWSYTNARQYEACQRAFYYQQKYYKESDPDTSGKKYQSTPSSELIGSPGTLVGIAVHRSISHQIDRWRRGEQMNMTAARRVATDIIQEYTEDSHSSDQAQGTDWSEIKPSLTSTAKSHLKIFFRVIWPRFESHRYITHESVESFYIDGHRVWVRPDLCTRDEEGHLVITDWKTGSLDSIEKPELQLLVYSLWAYRKLEPDLKRIRSQFIFTSDGDSQISGVDEEDLKIIRQRIIEDCETWEEKSNKDEFKTNPEADRCQSCPYLHECTDGQRTVS